MVNNDTVIAILAKGSSVKLRTSGYSMFPFIRKNDVLIISPIKNSKLKRGDIIAFTIKSELVAHRIIKFEKHLIITKGDGNMHFDQPLTTDQIFGIVDQHLRNGKIISWIHHSINKQIIAILSPILGVLAKISIYIYSHFKPRTSKRDK